MCVLYINIREKTVTSSVMFVVVVSPKSYFDRFAFFFAGATFGPQLLFTPTTATPEAIYMRPAATWVSRAAIFFAVGDMGVGGGGVSPGARKNR